MLANHAMSSDALTTPGDGDPGSSGMREATTTVVRPSCRLSSTPLITTLGASGAIAS